ncbi:MAG: TetR/AcrR family transcriptional regulator [Verrucomicrobiales bacterium]
MVKPSSKRMHAADRKEAIAGAAMGVFAAKGFARATTKDLAHAADVSEGLIYRHFESKDELYESIQNAICEADAPYIRGLNSREPSVETLVLVIYTMHALILECDETVAGVRQVILRLMIQSILEDGEFIKSFHDSRMAVLLPIFKKSAELARANGEMVDNGLRDEERFWFTHHTAVTLALGCAPPTEPFDYGSGNFASRCWNGFLFSLRGIGLTDETIQKHADPMILGRAADELLAD